MHKRSNFPAAALAATLMASGCGNGPVPPPSLTATAPGNISDIDVTGHVRAALGQSPALKDARIEVVTLKGDVRLTGVLESQAQIAEAIEIARAADGVHTIHDELTVRK